MSEYKAESVIGLSSLRTNQEPAGNASAARDNKRAQYLSKYMSGDDDGKKKRKKKKRKTSHLTAVHVVDEDAGWPADTERPQGPEDQVDDDALQADDDEGPVVENAAEVQHQLRLMQSQQQFQAQWEGEPSARTAVRAPARARHDSDDDSSPSRTARHDSDDDSPPRRPASPTSGQNPTSRSKAQRHDSDDESPPRRSAGQKPVSRSKPQRYDSEDESSPRRSAGPAAGQNPSSRSKAQRRHDADDESPPRRGGHAEKPARGTERAADVARGSRHDAAPPKAPLAGLVSLEEMSKQIREDRERLKQFDAVAAGRDAEAVYRVGGRAVTREEFQETQNSKQPKKQRKFIEEDVSWKTGLVQRRAAEARRQAQQEEGGKNMQRAFDDAGDDELRQELRMDDPMAQYFTSKKMDALSAANAAAPSALHDAELGGASGFSVPQEVPEHSWIRRSVQPLPNRYNIKPGRHWDGVPRSNGFEKKFVFQYQHKKAERARDEYVLAEDL